MTTHKSLRLEHAIARVNELDDDSVLVEITRLHGAMDERTEARLIKEALGFCYDRQVCEALKINYAKLPQKDYNRIYLMCGYSNKE